MTRTRPGWADKHPAEYAQALSREDTISLADARAVVPAYEFYVAPVKPSDIHAEQALSAAFFASGEIKKQVNVAAISHNVLPANYNSLHVPGL